MLIRPKCPTTVSAQSNRVVYRVSKPSTDEVLLLLSSDVDRQQYSDQASHS